MQPQQAHRKMGLFVSIHHPHQPTPGQPPGPPASCRLPPACATAQMPLPLDHRTPPTNHPPQPSNRTPAPPAGAFNPPAPKSAGAFNSPAPKQSGAFNPPAPNKAGRRKIPQLFSLPHLPNRDHENAIPRLSPPPADDLSPTLTSPQPWLIYPHPLTFIREKT
jgi:hypothetical protein